MTADMVKHERDFPVVRDDIVQSSLSLEMEEAMTLFSPSDMKSVSAL